MIRRVVIRGFKRFRDVTFQLPGHIVLAGPNNTGKTTVLQAIAAWGLALRRWKELNDYRKHRGGYTYAPITRQSFSAVPLRSFELLWRDRDYKGKVEIEIQSTTGWIIGMEFNADSTEQIYVRPSATSKSDDLKTATMAPVFVPAMTGLAPAEPVYQAPKIEQLLGQGKPGDVLRNILVEAHRSEAAWRKLQDSISRLFSYELLPPNDQAADIVAEYRERAEGPQFDIASAGSGFQQILMLLAFLHTRTGSVLLLDEPDAHLHVILQDAIYGELRSAAALQNSQLIIATHSEAIIDSVAPEELCVLLAEPRLLKDAVERGRLTTALRTLTNLDITLAQTAPGVLYLEDKTDLAILIEWAKILGHKTLDVLTRQRFWKKTVFQTRDGGAGIQSKEHYETLRLVRDDLPGLELVDGDANPGKGETPLTGQGLQRVRWRRYEIESYLLHPDAIARFIEKTLGSPDAARLNVEEMRKAFVEQFPPPIVREPLADHPFLTTTKARTHLLPPLLDAAGLQGLPYTHYHEIAAVMKPEEIHPEVREKLDAVLKAFRLTP